MAEQAAHEGSDERLNRSCYKYKSKYTVHEACGSSCLESWTGDELKHVLHVIIRPATAQKLVGTVIDPGQRRTEAVVTIELVRLAAVRMVC